MSLNFQNIEVRNIIAILAEFTGQNMIAGDDVSGTITLKLDDVPWDEALDFIMMSKELGKYQSGNVTLISPIDKIKNYTEKQQKMEDVVEKSDALVTEYIKINFAKAESFKNLLNGSDTGAFGSCGANDGNNSSNSSASPNSTSTLNDNKDGAPLNNQTPSEKKAKFEENHILSTRGSVVVDSRTNVLIVKDTAKKLEEVKKLIYQLDVPVKQVMIESRIVIADDSFPRNLGIKFGVGSKGVIGTNPNLSIGGAVGDVATKDVLKDSLFDLGAKGIGATPIGALGMTLAKGADYVLNLEVQALQSDGRGESIANPRVMTMDHCTAHIQQGVQIPYTVGGTTITSANTQFKDALLSLNVTPQITPTGAVLMNLIIKKIKKIAVLV